MARKQKKLIILHIDGLSYKRLLKHVKAGNLPTIKKLIENDAYEAIRYRTGIPSATPYAQAGIMHGDNYNIPSFTWFDKKAGVPVRFGALTSFKKIAHKYFQAVEPLTQGGASITTLYPAGATETFALAYNDPKSKTNTKFGARSSVLVRWFSNPLHIINWVYNTLIVILSYFYKYVQSYVLREQAAYKYLLANLLQEIFLHHMTRYAAVQAMKAGYPVIYAAFYAYDDGAHTFGPNDAFCGKMLRQIDKSIQYINSNRLKNVEPYELLVLSDHGQITSEPFAQKRGKNFGEYIAEWLPNHDIVEIPGKHIEPITDRQDGEVILTYCGGLGHMYLREWSHRVEYKELVKRYPKLIKQIVSLPEIEFVMCKDEKQGVLITKIKTYNLSQKKNKALFSFLRKFDDPEIVLNQLRKLNTFPSAGDIVIFSLYEKDTQINLENQQGGHGAIGGDQMYPFLLVKKEWNILSDTIHDAMGVYKVIKEKII